MNFLQRKKYAIGAHCKKRLNATLKTCALTITFGLCTFATSAAHAAGILILGDSLSAGYGIPQGQGWVTLLQNQLRGHEHDQPVINASISGETTEGGRNRLPALLQKYRPDIVVVELGANDGLRGFQIDRLRDNLTSIVQASRDSNAKVLLVGMKIPPNYGLRYTSDFHASYTTIAKKFDVPLVPFLLDGVAAHPDLMQDDGLHPNAAAQKRLLDNVWPYLKKLL